MTQMHHARRCPGVTDGCAGCRRRNVDYERLPASKEALIHIAMIRQMLSCCASNLTVNFSTIIVGRAGEPVSVFNLDAPQLTLPCLGFFVSLRIVKHSQIIVRTVFSSPSETLDFPLVANLPWSLETLILRLAIKNCPKYCQRARSL
jgi:hypothetical protein